MMTAIMLRRNVYGSYELGFGYDSSALELILGFGSVKSYFVHDREANVEGRDRTGRVEGRVQALSVQHAL